MKWPTQLWAVMLGVLLTYSVAPAATPLDELETWSGGDTAGWTNAQTGATLGNPGGCLELSFATQERPALAADTARRPLLPGTLVTQVTLRVSAVDTPPSRLYLCLHSRRSGATWFLRLAVPEAGTTRQYQVPLSTAAGWSLGPAGTPEAFAADLRTADWLGVHVRRHGNPARQRYQLDDVRLQGLYAPEDRDLDGLETTWEERYGFDPDDPRDAEADADGDGMSNYAEARAGTDPTDPASRFRLRIRPAPTGQGVTLEWDTITKRTYALWWTAALGEAPQLLQAGIEATPTVNTYLDPASANRPAGFYQVVVEP